MLNFSNPGLIDPRAFIVMGVNAKTTDNPIGYFGTGLKYAIAVLLRTGHKIEILSGRDKYQFHLKPDSFRGKDFQFIEMEHFAEQGSDLALASRQTLGYTTELGKNWEVWQAYRELYCNAKDEGGQVHEVDEGFPMEGVTQVLVTGKPIVLAHRERGQYFLQTSPLWVGNECEIHPGNSGSVYYRGIKIHTLEKKSIYSYNITAPVRLTEDRTAAAVYDLWPIIARTLAQCNHKPVLRHSLAAPEETLEGTLDYDYGSVKAVVGPTFQEIIAELSKDKSARINHSARKILKDAAQEEAEPPALQLTPVQERMLAKALKFCASIGCKIEHQVIITNALGYGVMGLAREGKMYISSIAFDQGTKRLAGTLFEEHTHLVHGLADRSLAMQNYLVDKIMTLGEELMGEPL